MPALDWTALVLFAGATLLVALYGLAVSGHFPAEFRGTALQSAGGAILLWGTMAVTGLAAIAILVRAWSVLPWYAAVIGGGTTLLFAPLLLQPLSDAFVNGRRALVAFSLGAALLAVGMWAMV